MSTKEKMDIERTTAQVLQEHYTIPLYQRNYNWGIPEIRQFLQDIYECYYNDPTQNYYIGSLVVFKRTGDQTYFEVIDGQQRLTTIHLIARLISDENNDFKRLQYDSRKEVEDFFDRLSIEKDTVHQREEDAEQSNLSNFFLAVHTILNEKLESEFDSTISISSLKENNDLKNFAEYFFTKVMLVRVEMPEDTDVANYFEIMNNRGRQLQEHEILKALLMSSIAETKDRSIFGNLWDACSQMDRPIQKFFDTEQRELLFGENYDTIKPKKIHQLKYDKTNVEKYSVLEIIANKANKTQLASQEENENELDDEIEYTSIIDFSNFLIHVLKLIYVKAEIPLSSDMLLKIYKSITKSELSTVTPMEFIEKLLFYRVVFDRYIVKSEAGIENMNQFEGDENNLPANPTRARWMLVKPVMYWKNTKYKGRKYPSLNFKNTFENIDYQERAIKLLSMLQVTYRQRKNKNYLQFILSLFDPTQPKTINFNDVEFLQKLEGFTLKQFDKLELEEYFGAVAYLEVEENTLYAEGTKTPHFIFNFIDYLLWIDMVWNDVKWEIDNDFDFTYRNSIEHHFPQAQIQMLKGNKELIHCIGNLCLISKGSNSKLNDRSALDKATDPRYSSGVLTPKRKIMYSITKQSNEWNSKQILEHYSAIANLIKRRYDILNNYYD